MRYPIASKIAEGASEYYIAQYQQGYDEGYAGREYAGRTYIGYYGWLDGKAAREQA